MSNPNSCLTSEFQSLLYYIFTYKKRYDKNEAAIFLNKSPDTFQRYCSGRLPIPVDNARDLIHFIAQKNPEDTELIEFFCIPYFIPYLAEKVKAINREGIRIKEIKLSILNGKTIEEIEKILEDGKVEKLEYKRAHQLLINIQKLVIELDEILKSKV